MPRYMVQAAYTAAAAAAFVKNPQDRAGNVKALVEKLGGKLESFHYSLGDYDVVVITTLPDDTAAAATSLAVTAAGHLRAYKTTKLLTPDEFMTAQQKAHSLDYSAPRMA